MDKLGGGNEGKSSSLFRRWIIHFIKHFPENEIEEILVGAHPKIFSAEPPLVRLTSHTVFWHTFT